MLKGFQRSFESELHSYVICMYDYKYQITFMEKIKEKKHTLFRAYGLLYYEEVLKQMFIVQHSAAYNHR